MDGNFSPAAFLSGILLIATVFSSSAFLEPYDLLYDNAVQAFYNSDYASVVRFMEGALSSYSEVRRSKVRCRLRCQDQHPQDETFSDLRFFDVVLRRAACMNTCIDEKLGSQSLHKVSEDVVQDFQRRIPYNYLQLAYQKVSERRGQGGLGSLHVKWTLNGHCCPLSGELLVHITCWMFHQLVPLLSNRRQRC